MRQLDRPDFLFTKRLSDTTNFSRHPWETVTFTNLSLLIPRSDLFLKCYKFGFHLLVQVSFGHRRLLSAFVSARYFKTEGRQLAILLLDRSFSLRAHWLLWQGLDQLDLSFGRQDGLAVICAVQVLGHDAGERVLGAAGSLSLDGSSATVGLALDGLKDAVESI